MSDEYPPLFERKEVDGVPVVRDEVLQSGLSARAGRVVPIHGIRVLTLEDKRQVFGCRDCEVTGTRGEVVKHRNAEHDKQVGSKRGAGAAVDPASGLPEDLAGMTLGEVFELAASMSRWGDLYETERARAESLAAELAQAKKDLAAEQKALTAIKGRLKKLVGDD